MCPQFCLKIKDGCYVCQCGGMTSLLYAFIGQKIIKKKKKFVNLYIYMQINSTPFLTKNIHDDTFYILVKLLVYFFLSFSNQEKK